MFCRTTVALGLLWDAKRSCQLIFKTTPQLSNLINDFVDQHFGLNAVGSFQLIGLIMYLLSAYQTTLLLVVCWLSAGAMRATGPRVFHVQQTSTVLYTQWLGKEKRENQRKHTRHPMVSVLNQHAIASATFCYLKESHKASPSSQRAEKLYLFVGGAITQGNGHRQGKNCMHFLQSTLIFILKTVISNGISLLKMKLHVVICNENCGLSFIRNTGQFGGMKIGFQIYEKLYIHLKIS